MLKVGLIGAGTIAGVHAQGWSEIPDTKLAVVFDINKENAEKLAQRFNCVATSDYESIIEDKDIDIIDICTPTTTHKEYVLKSALTKKYIFCEKPIARTVEDAKEMVKKCKEKRVRLMIGHVLRFFQEYAKMKEQIESGVIGKPAVVRTSRCSGFPRAWDNWYADFNLSGGVIDMIIHDFDWLRWCFGDVDRIYAKGLGIKKYNEKNFVDYALVIIRFKNRVIAHVEGSWAEAGGFKTSVEVTGTKGMLNFSSSDSIPIISGIKKGVGNQPGVSIPESPVAESPYTLELRHFVDCINRGKEFLVTADDAVKALEIAIASLESIKTGEVIKL